MDTLKLALALRNYQLGVSFLATVFYLDAMAPGEVAEPVRKARGWGAERQVEIINTYHKQGILTEILLIILAKKLEFIAAATTVNQVKEIIRPSLPEFQAGVIKVMSPYHVEEKELVLWSLFSAQCLLRHEAQERALELFDRYQHRWGDDRVVGEMPAEHENARCRENQNEKGKTQRKGT